MLYAILKGMSTFVSWLPYKFVVRLGRNCGKLYYHIAKKQRVRAEKTIMERMGMEEKRGQGNHLPPFPQSRHDLYGNALHACPQ